MLKAICGLWLAMALVCHAEETAVPLTADEIIHKVVARDKVLVANRKIYDFDIEITREQLDDDKKVTSKETEHAVVPGDKRPSYGTRESAEDPKQEQKKTSREEPFELLKIIDHYTYQLEGTEQVNGVECYKIAFTPKANLTYSNREEKVLNHVSGHIWAAKDDFTVIRNEGSIMEPVSVAWIFATLHEMEFHFDAMQLPNGEYGPGHLTYRYLVHVPFTHLHERDTRTMSNYRPAGTGNIHHYPMATQ